MTSVFENHISSPLFSPPMRFTSPSPNTPRINSRAKSNNQRDCVTLNSSKSSTQNYSSNTPKTFRSRNLYSTPPSGGRVDTRESISHGSRSKNGFSARQTKLNPLVQSRGSINFNEDRNTRRLLFLNRVKEAGDEKRWLKRKGGLTEGDEEFLRMLWINEEKDWKEQFNREALLREMTVDFEDLNELQDFFQEKRDHSESDFTRNTNYVGGGDTIETQSVYGSDYDDDEYDQIFMELIQQENGNISKLSRKIENEEDIEMVDMG